jgi:transaldolase
MSQEWYDLRETLLFKTAPAEFAASCHEVRRQLLTRQARGNAPSQAAVAALTADLCLDLQSYLPHWHLQRPGAPERVAAGLLASEATAFRALLTEWGALAELERVRDEEARLRRSNFLRLTRLADEGRVATRWGYDYAHGIGPAMRRGALLVTTNPPLMNMIRKERPQQWEPVREELRREHPGSDRDRLASLFSLRVVLENCRILRPVYEASGGRYGYVNLQVNPHAAQDAARMAEDIEGLYDLLRERLGGTPNVVFKVPGTRAALETVRRVTGKGIGVTITLGFSVDQHLAFAEAIEAGTAPLSFLVMMNGRLDDPIRDELAGLGLANAAELAKWASTAVVRRSYDLLYRQGTPRRSALLIASLRGPWNVDSAITDEPAPVFITSFPDKTEEYDAQEREIVSHIAEPVAAETLAGLRRSALFRQAYEPGAIGVDGFDSYYPVAITLKAFAAAWDELAAWLAG